MGSGGVDGTLNSRTNLCTEQQIQKRLKTWYQYQICAWNSFVKRFCCIRFALELIFSRKDGALVWSRLIFHETTFLPRRRKFNNSASASGAKRKIHHSLVSQCCIIKKDARAKETYVSAADILTKSEREYTQRACRQWKPGGWIMNAAVLRS